MKLRAFYEKIIAAGKQADPRSSARIAEVLRLEKEKYDALKKEEQEFFDSDRLVNPYADTRVLFGDLDTDVTTILLGIDIDPAEIILADRLREKGTAVDLVIAHHPEGHAYAAFYDVMRMQADIFNSCGVSIVTAEALTEERLTEVKHSVSSANHMRSVDIARVLNIPFMCVHTPADNHVVQYLTRLMAQKKPTTVRDIMALLRAIPEYRAAAKRNAGPFVMAGSESARCGKILVDMTGGTECTRDIFSHLATAGIGTLIVMHLSDGHLKKAKEQKINVINAGHIASDNLGINLLLDAVLGKQKIQIVPVAGFERITRK